MGRVFRLLSSEGGGVRGVIPAQFLIALERELQRLSGRPHARIADFFDFFAGTSTGGVLTCLLLTPDPEHPDRPKYSARDVLKTYEDVGDIVFSSSLWRRLRSAGGFLNRKFDAGGLEAAFLRYFGETRVRELLKPCLITAYDILRGKPHFFMQHEARTRPGNDFYVRDAARATSAAPTFFEVALCRNEQGKAYPLIDGGVFANNPALCAFSEAHDFWESLPVNRMLMLSLGTGSVPINLHYEAARAYGIVQWMGPLSDIMVSGVSDTVDHQLSKVFGAARCRNQYLRMSPVLGGEPLPAPDIDDARPENLAALRDCGERLFEENRPRILEFAEKLVAEAPTLSRRLPALVSQWFGGRAR